MTKRAIFWIVALCAPGLKSQESSKAEQIDLGPLMEPEPVAFTFASPGWYLLGGAIILVLGIMVYKRIKNFKRNAYRREAVARIEKMLSPEAGLEETDLLNSHLAELKIVALKTYGRIRIASMTGKDWWAFLESTGKNTSFSTYTDAIDDSVFRDITPDHKTVLEISELTKRWIKTHT